MNGPRGVNHCPDCGRMLGDFVGHRCGCPASEARLAGRYQPQPETLPDGSDVAALRAEIERLRDLLRECEYAVLVADDEQPFDKWADLLRRVREVTGSGGP